MSTARRLILGLRSLVLVDLLLEPSLDGLSAVSPDGLPDSRLVERYWMLKRDEPPTTTAGLTGTAAATTKPRHDGVGAPRSLQGRPAFADEVDRLTDPVDSTWVEDSLTWFPRCHDVPDWYIKDRIRDGLRVPAHVWIASLAGLTTAVPPSESATISAPTLIIWGERDELLPPQDKYLLAGAIPGSRLIVYDDTSHLVLWEQPERVATDLSDFVAGLSRFGQNSTRIS